MLHQVARQAYERMPTDHDDTAGQDDDALIAILFSAASLEALIGELEVTARMYAKLNPALGKAGDVLAEAEDGHMTVQGKYLLAGALFPGVALERGKQPYQDFALLMRLRN